MVMEVSTELEIHIQEKIDYHQRLLDLGLEVENYRSCAIHHKEIERLKGLLDPNYQTQE